MNEVTTEALRKRLRWRVRRGTRELDRLLGEWLDDQFDSAGPDKQLAFDALLDTPDPQLWAWLSAAEPAPRDDWQSIIDDIRARHQL